MLLSLLPSQRILHNFCCSHNLDEQTGKLVVGASSWLLMPGELVNVSCLFMMESGEDEMTVVTLLLVSGSVSLCSWQSQRENSPSLRCELGKCDDLSENVCVHITFVLCSWEHELRNSLVTPCPAAPVQSSHAELAVVQASTAMSPCLTCGWSVLTCDAGTGPG